MAISSGTKSKASQKKSKTCVRIFGYLLWRDLAHGGTHIAFVSFCFASLREYKQGAVEEASIGKGETQERICRTNDTLPLTLAHFGIRWADLNIR